MAGVKGMKGGGGARPNTGGARPGAGRKPKPPVAVVVVQPEPVDHPAPPVMLTEPVPDEAAEFLGAVMQGLIDPSPSQLKAAIALLTKRAVGVKDERQERAVRAAGRFSPSAPPRLVSSR